MKKNETNTLLEITIFTIAIILSIIGVMSVYSAGSYFASVVRSDPFYYVQRQALFVVLSLIATVIILKVKYKQLLDYRKIRQISIGISVVLLALLIFGTATKGAKAWINLGPISLQPAEFAKLVLIWNTAFYFAETRYLDALPLPENPTKVQQIWGMYHPEVTLGVTYLGILLPVLLQPDTGGFAIMAGVVGLLWLASGSIPAKKAIQLLSGIIIGGYASLFIIGSLFGSSDYRIRRILVFLNPFSVSPDDSRQIRNSFYALARGGLTGVGVGNSVQKTGYLPEFHTDFILSIIGEELGILGVFLVLGLLFALVYLIFRRSTTVKTTFDKFMLIGIAMMFLIQIFLNVAGVTSLAPLTGVTLPFISYGGSSMLASFIAVALVIKISLHDKKQANTKQAYKNKATNLPFQKKQEPIKRRRMSVNQETGGVVFEENQENSSR